MRESPHDSSAARRAAVPTPSTWHPRAFWWGYAAVSLAYAATYMAVFLADRPTRSLAYVAVAAAINVTSAAALGVLVVALTAHTPWPRATGQRARFAGTHALAAALYSLLWLAAVMLFLSLRDRIAGLPSVPRAWSGPALHWQLFAGVMLYGTIAGSAYASHAMTRLHDEEARVRQADALRVEAELHALRSRLQPHFLFNTLHSLLELVRAGDPAAETGLERLADLLRHVLRTGDGDDVLVREELALVEDYVALEHLRLGDRLRWTVVSIPPHRNAEFPRSRFSHSSRTPFATPSRRARGGRT